MRLDPKFITKFCKILGLHTQTSIYFHAIVHPKRLPPFQASATHSQSRETTYMCESSVCKSQSLMQENSAPKLPSTGILRVQQVVRFFSILRSSGWLYFGSSSQWIIISAVQCRYQNMGWSSMFFILYSHSPWCLHQIYCKWYVFACTHQCVIYIIAQIMQPCSRTFFFVGKLTQQNPLTYTAFNGAIHVVFKIIQNVMG